MRLRRIYAENYRTLVQAEFDFLSDYCTISGKNNAGKSAILRLLDNLLKVQERVPWGGQDNTLDYQEDVTQWVKDKPSIHVSYELCISREDDPALVVFVEKIAELEITEKEATLKINLTLDSTDNLTTEVAIDGTTATEQAAKEIVKKLQGSESLFLHNSTTHQDFYFGGGRRAKAMYEFSLSSEEQRRVSEAERNVQRRIKQLAKEHTDDLNQMLGRLTEKYDVVFSTLQSFSTRRMPLGINLTDKSVDVPLNDWGSGTQNRMHVMMSILKANRIKTLRKSEDRITPIVVIEEPESFLHPSAQAEFGRLLQELSKELGIQIIAATHSPYILNQISPESNILLERKMFRRKQLETVVVPTSGDDWMAPFADNLGIVPPEFESWRGLFSLESPRVLLVEGQIDKDYFEYLRETWPDKFEIEPEIEIEPYGGKDALKNSMLLRFVLGKFDRVFVTFDLDALNEVARSLEGLGLKRNHDFVPLGVDKPGRDAIEGLLPDRTISTVASKETDLIMQLSSTKSNERRAAKSALKKAYLEEFKRHKNYTDAELQPLAAVVRQIAKNF
jgi:putative ATP-dependent endonuclease of the OLD family